MTAVRVRGLSGEVLWGPKELDLVTVFSGFLNVFGPEFLVVFGFCFFQWVFFTCFFECFWCFLHEKNRSRDLKRSAGLGLPL